MKNESYVSSLKADILGLDKNPYFRATLAIGGVALIMNGLSIASGGDASDIFLNELIGVSCLAYGISK